MKIKILESLKPILEQAENVCMDPIKINEYARDYDKTNYKHWLSISPFEIDHLSEKQKINFLFTLNSISFCYWGNPKWTTQYNKKEYDGAQAMIACLGKAIEKGINFNPSQLVNFQRDDLENILKGNIEIPLLDERLRYLRDVGNITQRKFKGDFRNVIDQSHGNALQLVDLLVENYPSFEDSAIYKGHKVYFNKRAQLLAADLSYLFGGFDKVSGLTACADYKIPQVLRRYGILKYSTQLTNIIHKREIIPAGSDIELEIRAYTILAVELLKNEIFGVTSNQVSDGLWLEGQIKLLNDEPYLLVRTTNY
jgi:hypothetical protein